MKIVVAAKKIGSNWEGTLIANGAFARAFVESNLETLVQKGMVGSLVDRPEGVSVIVTVEDIEVPAAASPGA